MSPATPEFGSSPLEPAADAARALSNLWWLWLVVGIAWIAAALVILQFDQASVTTIGVIVGIMFTFAGMQQLTLAFIADVAALAVGDLRRPVPDRRRASASSTPRTRSPASPTSSASCS